MKARARAAIGALLVPLAGAGCGRGEPTTETDRAAHGATAAPGWFSETAADAGLGFRHSAGDGEGYPMTGIMGSGAALFDYDQDGDLDVYLVDAGEAGPQGTPNRLFRQEPGGVFSDATEASGLGDPGYGMGVALGDVDNDGDLDLFVSNAGPDTLYENLGGGRFARVVSEVGDPRWSTSACFLDYDRDGALDLYVATYVDYDPTRRCRDRAGSPEFCGPEVFPGLPDRLFRGRGDGSFEEMTTRTLQGQPSNKGLGLVCADLDGDSLVDVYVANDGEANQLWINRGAGPDGVVRFEDRALEMGAAVDAFGRPEASMGLAAGDVDRDGDIDLFATHLDHETNTLYVNTGDGFEDRTGFSGLGPSSLALTGFGTVLADFDLDGDLDLAVVDGRVRRGASPAERAARRAASRVASDVPPRFADYAEPNLFFVNDGSGRFSEAAAEGAALTAAGAVEVSRALIAGDIDGDGDLDLLETTCGGPVRLYRNDAPRGSGSHWLRVRAVDPDLRRDALGATVEVRAGGQRLVRPLISAQSYLAAAEPEVHFGLGEAERVDAIAVRWPDGALEVFPGVPADRAVTIRRGEGGSR